jgi:ssDNA-binding Zn-finger/Zn-ribbon topoisomerase 1
MKHLKPEQYYIDLYDRHTVERCRYFDQRESDDPLKHAPEGMTLEGAKRWERAVTEVIISFVKGERYEKKSETLREWMNRDEAHDRHFEAAQAPENIRCRTCVREMFVQSKHSWSMGSEKPRVLFFYDCRLEHSPSRAIFDNGEEFEREKPLCPKCQTPVVEEDKSDESKFVTISTCPNCGNVETSEIERTANKPEIPDPNYKADRARFCLSDKDGMSYMEGKQNLEQLRSLIEKDKEKEKEEDLYDAVAKIQKLKIIELEQLLAPLLEKEHFIKLTFKDPEVTKDVYVPFVVHDAKVGREERASSLDLQKLIKKTLSGTNWRLMSEGTHYRLGMLEGKLRAYEREEDLVELMRLQEKREHKKQTPKKN